MSIEQGGTYWWYDDEQDEAVLATVVKIWHNGGAWVLADGKNRYTHCLFLTRQECLERQIKRLEEEAVEKLYHLRVLNGEREAVLARARHLRERIETLRSR